MEACGTPHMNIVAGLGCEGDGRPSACRTSPTEVIISVTICCRCLEHWACCSCPSRPAVYFILVRPTTIVGPSSCLQGAGERATMVMYRCRAFAIVLPFFLSGRPLCTTNPYNILVCTAGDGYMGVSRPSLMSTGSRLARSMKAAGDRLSNGPEKLPRRRQRHGQSG